MILKVLDNFLPKYCKLDRFVIKKNTNGIRGIYCKKDIRKGELILRLI